jgi:hypothetical protein
MVLCVYRGATRPPNGQQLPVGDLYKRFGIDPTHAFENHAGQPIPILTNGEPIAELL